jgi:small subunit ribosomal protein S6
MPGHTMSSSTGIVFMAKPSYTYELTYIVNAALGDEQIKDLVARVNKYITDHDGEILECDEWGNRRLAFPLRKKRNGYYVNLVFTAPGDIIPRLERSLEIDDNVLRYLTLRLDAKMLRAFEKQRAAA